MASRDSTVLNVVLVFLSASLLIMAFPIFDLSLLAWIALLPLLFILRTCRHIRAAWGFSYLFGFLFFTGIMYWLSEVSVIGMILLDALLAFFMAAFGVGAYLFFAATHGYRRAKAGIVILPALWVVLEYLRTHLLSGFPWALLGYSQARYLPIIQIADLTGVYGVSYLVVLGNLAIFICVQQIQERKRPFVPLICGVLCVTAALAYGQYSLRHWRRGGNVFRIAAVQGNVMQKIKFDPRYMTLVFNKYLLLSSAAAHNGADLIVWPETAFPGYFLERDHCATQLRARAKTLQVPFLIGAVAGDREDVYNSALLIGSEGEIIGQYDKIHLVPFGEFLPAERLLGILRSLIARPIGAFSHGEEYTVFSLPFSGQRTGHNRPIRFSALICFEDIFPDLARRFVGYGAEFLVVMTNDAWFGMSSAPFQHAQASILRAVENRVPVVRVANTGVTCAIDRTGAVTGIVHADNGGEIFVDGFLVADVTLGDAPRTFYSRYGDVFAGGCLVLILSFMLFMKARTCLKNS